MQYNGDELYWNKEWFKHILEIYGDRHLLSKEKQYFLILRTGLQNLFQGRALRLDLTTLTDLVNTLTEQLDLMDNENNRRHIALLNKL